MMNSFTKRASVLEKEDFDFRYEFDNPFINISEKQPNYIT